MSYRDYLNNLLDEMKAKVMAKVEKKGYLDREYDELDGDFCMEVEEEVSECLNQLLNS